MLSRRADRQRVSDAVRIGEKKANDRQSVKEQARQSGRVDWGQDKPEVKHEQAMKDIKRPRKTGQRLASDILGPQSVRLWLTVHS